VASTDSQIIRVSPSCVESLTPPRRWRRARPSEQFTRTASGMKLITAIIRPECLPAVKAALFRAGVTGVTFSRVSGHGGEREVVQQYRAETVVLEFHEKVKVEMAVSEPYVEPTIAAIVSSARTGEVGDGKIFVQHLERVVRIRTGETDTAALTPVTADAVQRLAQRQVAP
jgi:nitrogen regulatory protein P-II 1